MRADRTVGSRQADFGQFGGRIHLLVHVEVVVAGAAVRSQADDNSLVQHGRDGGDAGGQFHVALGIVDDLAAVIGEEPHVFFVHHHAVKGDETLVEKADLLQKRCGPFAELLLQLPGLGRVFQKMRRQGDPVAVGKGFGRFQKLRRAGVEAVRFHHDVDQRIVSPASG